MRVTRLGRLEDRILKSNRSWRLRVVHVVNANVKPINSSCCTSIIPVSGSAHTVPTMRERCDQGYGQCPIQYNVELHVVSITSVAGLTLLIVELCFALLEKQTTSSSGDALPIIMTRSGRVYVDLETSCFP